jgi:hypothetical protein
MSARRAYDVFLQGEYAGTVWGTRKETQAFFADILRPELLAEALRTMFARRRRA